MGRATKEIGDIFEVKIDESKKKYFQYIANDMAQLGSDVIRVFKSTYNINEKVDISLVISDEIEFYTHCIIKVGIKLSFWEKVGNSPELGAFNHILFRNTNDYGIKAGQEPVKVSNDWYVWKINDTQFTRVGKLEGDNTKAEIGLVFNPRSIVNRMKTGEYGGSYPDYC